MLSGFKKYLNETKIEQIANLDHVPSKEELYEILGDFVRSEKIAWKDIKLRTFITEGNSRNDTTSHVYDVTYGSIEPNVDNLVIIDDSIVRGTTLKESILRILDRLHPKKIVVVSVTPQIRCRLLWYRYGKAGRVLRVPCCHPAFERAQDGRPYRADL